MVEWLNAGGGAKDESRVILVRELYGAVDKEDGWLISGLDDDDNSAFGPIEMSVEEQMHWSAIKDQGRVSVPEDVEKCVKSVYVMKI